MAAGSPAELEQRAARLGVDYLLVAEIAELKVSKPGGLTKVMKATAKEAPKDITEAKMSVQLVAPGAKPRLSKTTSGKLQRSKTRQQFLDGSLGRGGNRSLGGNA